jgi:5-methylcytosine-specific restriction endonuclease McrA
MKDPLKTKICKKCPAGENVKLVSEFHKHKLNKDGLSNICKVCACAATAAWRERPGNRERGVKQMQDWMKIPGNAERKAVMDAHWHHTHKENGRLSSARRRARHKDDPEFRAYHRHKTHVWERSHPENVRQRANRRNSRKRGLPQIDVVDLDVLYARDKRVCSLCGKKVQRADASQDHIIPITKPGSEESYRNSALAHIDCNRRKHNGVVPQQMRLF